MPELVENKLNNQALKRYDIRVATIMKDVKNIKVKRMSCTNLQKLVEKDTIEKTRKEER